MLVGRVLTDGRLNARVKCDLTDNLTLKINAQVFIVLQKQCFSFVFNYELFFSDIFSVWAANK